MHGSIETTVTDQYQHKTSLHQETGGAEPQSSLSSSDDDNLHWQQ